MPRLSKQTTRQMQTVNPSLSSRTPSPQRHGRGRKFRAPEPSLQNANPVPSPTHARVKKQAKRQDRQRSSSSDESSPRRSKVKLCNICHKNVSSNAFADHIKVHKLLSDEYGVKAARPCNACLSKGRECRVARVPGAQGLKTFRCRHCLKYHESCSYMEELRSQDTSTLQVHPAADHANPPELGNSSGSESSET
ncbi:hypothetical protein EDB80DRAFT_771058 [Ilyonectria destructans]|nr:hypothetical protein EDB80DRAFT_771058 [Ilyonectria destructans]